MMILAIPDRLPSLIVLVGFWIPPAVAGWVAAGSLLRSATRERATREGATREGATRERATRERATRTYAWLAIFVLGYAAAWFTFNLGRMPPYIPGATTDPTFAPPRAVAALAVVAGALILPGSALACAWAFRRRGRMSGRPSTSREP